ncbi:MAG: hypothetical protein V3W18_08920 [candidate division Zixibacteria bacterium]
MNFKLLIKEDKNILFIPFLAVALRLIIFIFIPNIYEDAYITFRYAENLAVGNGFVYNLGERVLGTTTPFFGLLLAFFKYFGVPCEISSLAINLVSEGVTTFIIYTLLKGFSGDKIAAIPALLYVFSPSNISWSISGMETAFYTAIIALSFYNLIRKEYFWAMLFGVLSAIIRIDGLSVTAVVFIFVLINEKSIKSRTILLPLLLFILWEAFLFQYFDALIPTTLQAKLNLYSAHQPSKYTALFHILQKFFVKGNYLSSFLSLAFISGIVIVVIKKIEWLALPSWFFTYFGAMSLANVHMHGWYYIPPLFSYITIAGITLLFLYEYVTKIKPSAKPIIKGVFLSGIIAMSLITLIPKIQQIKDERGLTRVLTEIGVYLNRHTPEDATIYLEPIGFIGYFSKRYIFDESGLVSPQFIELSKLENNISTKAKKIALANPDYLLLRIKYLSEYYQYSRLSDNFREIERYNHYFNGIQEGLVVFERIK